VAAAIVGLATKGVLGALVEQVAKLVALGDQRRRALGDGMVGMLRDDLEQLGLGEIADLLRDGLDRLRAATDATLDGPPRRRLLPLRHAAAHRVASARLDLRLLGRVRVHLGRELLQDLAVVPVELGEPRLRVGFGHRDVPSHGVGDGRGEPVDRGVPVGEVFGVAAERVTVAALERGEPLPFTLERVGDLAEPAGSRLHVAAAGAIPAGRVDGLLQLVGRAHVVAGEDVVAADLDALERGVGSCELRMVCAVDADVAALVDGEHLAVGDALVQAGDRTVADRLDAVRGLVEVVGDRALGRGVHARELERGLLDALQPVEGGAG
jgi:hypothetical protein